jgi:DNA-binding transcriptional LysR family regulator
MPDLRQLRAFVAVAEERNFTRAAERLHMAQQAVSKSVRGLERELGVELLERTTREVRLTPAGEELLASGGEALRAAELAFERASEVGGGRRGAVELGTSPAVGPATVQEVVAALREDAPELRVSVRAIRPREYLRALRDRDVDVILARTLRDDAGLDSAALRPTPAVLAVPAEHRLAGRGPVSLAELDGERMLTWNPPRTPYTDMLVGRLAAAGARVEPVEARVMGTYDLGDLAERDAFAIVPSGWRETGGVKVVEPREELSLPLLAVWLAGVPSTAVERVRERMSSPA